jgi:hypothetical protein
MESNHSEDGGLYYSIIVRKDSSSIQLVIDKSSNDLKIIFGYIYEFLKKSKKVLAKKVNGKTVDLGMGTKWNTQAWAEAKKRCRLNEDDIQMAKELGMTPKSLIKNIPAPDQQWKGPVKVWIRDLYEEKFNKTITVTHIPKEESHKALLI